MINLTLSGFLRETPGPGILASLSLVSPLPSVLRVLGLPSGRLRASLPPTLTPPPIMLPARPLARRLALLAAIVGCAPTSTPAPAPAPAAATAAATASPSLTPLTAQQIAAMERLRNDWANLARYRPANAALGAPAAGENRVVFMGNSITDAWAKSFPTMFPDKPYVGRGISGQTTPQMLVRFRQDVVALKPKVVVILAGINDIAGNTGPSTL